MSAIQIAEKRITDGINKIFTPKDYPAFLLFASNFLNFSYKNIILIYLQNPKAKCIAGINAWKNLTGLGLKKNSVPILILYPVLSDNCIKYEIQKVFDYSQIDNENIKEEQIKEHLIKCDKQYLFEGLKAYLLKSGMSIYSSDDLKEGIAIDDNIITINAALNQEDKFMKTLELYIAEKVKDNERLVSGAIVHSTLYMIYSYYDIKTSHITFPYLAVPLPDDKKKAIFEKSCSLSYSIIENINNYYIEKLKEKPKKER